MASIPSKPRQPGYLEAQSNFRLGMQDPKVKSVLEVSNGYPNVPDGVGGGSRGPVGQAAPPKQLFGSYSASPILEVGSPAPVPEDETRQRSGIPATYAPSPLTLDLRGQNKDLYKDRLSESELLGIVDPKQQMIRRVPFIPGGLTEADGLDDFPPDDEAEHVVVPLARPTANPKTARPMWRPKGGLLERGLFSHHALLVIKPGEASSSYAPCPVPEGAPVVKEPMPKSLPLTASAPSVSSPAVEARLGVQRPKIEGARGALELLREASPCPAGEAQEKEQEVATVGKDKPRKRTWMYYPPPTGDQDAVPVDVIDHESEVLIIRREPPAQMRRQVAVSMNVDLRGHAPNAKSPKTSSLV